MYKNSGARQRVLDELLRRGPASVSELAATLGVVPVTMRSHLAALEQQGLIVAEEERGRIGRPRRRYRLSAQAEALLPQRADGLAAELLDSLQTLAGQRAVEQLLDVAASRYASRHSQQGTEGTLEDRVAAATAVLHQEGGAAAWEDAGERLLIRDFHCPYGQLARERQETCRYHTQVLVRLLGSPVLLERSIARGDSHCLFAVPRQRPHPPMAVRTLSDGRERS